MDSTMAEMPHSPGQFLSTHKRNTSSGSNASAYHFILEHILSYPGTYQTNAPSPGTGVRSSDQELTLRSIYSLNSAAPSLNSSGAAGTPQMFTPTSPVIPEFPTFSPSQVAVHDNRVAAAVFKSNIMDHIAKIPQQPASLPPAFVTSFLDRCFPMELERVDFPQSLTALDYLKDLEMRRRKELAYALQCHGIDRRVIEEPQTPEELERWSPTVANWISLLEQKERRADKLYTQLYIALRRWILINEMALQPFNKHNCHAMLNTLYPPVESVQPSARLTIPLLMVQREGFFNYVKAVESQGPMCLQTLMRQGARPGEENGWPAVKRTLNHYLNLSNKMIRESQEISSMEVTINRTPTIPLAPPPVSLPRIPSLNHGTRKTDSGIYVTINENKHIKSPSTSTNQSATTTSTASSSVRSSEVPSSAFEFGKGSTLERLARELRKMRPRRIKVDEIVKPGPAGDYSDSTPTSPVKSPSSPTKSLRFSLRKMKSFGTLGELRSNNSSMASLKTTPDDYAAKNRARMGSVGEQRRVPAFSDSRRFFS